MRLLLTSFGLVVGLGCLGAIGVVLASQKTPGRGAVGWNDAKTQFELPNGWNVSPVGDRTALPGDMPGQIVAIPGTPLAVVTTSGFHDHSVNLIESATGKILDSKKTPNSWFGAAYSEGILYTSGGGARPDIRKWRIEGSRLVEAGTILLDSIPEKERFVTAIIPAKVGIYVANTQSDEVLHLDPEGKVLARTKVGYRPRSLALSPDGKLLAVSEWGDQGVVLLDPVTLATVTRFTTRPHPTSLVWHPDGRLFVAESGSNSVAVYQEGELARITVSVTKEPIGPTPTCLALDPAGRTLYATLAGDNAVAVLDLSSARPKLAGHIPTERWPSFVSLTPDGAKLLIATAKGFYGPNAEKGGQGRTDRGAPFKYIGTQLEGAVASLQIPSRTDLARFSRQARSNLNKGERAVKLSAENRKSALENLKRIKHVIYVIRENRTYDQVLGDLPQGNGDPSLVFFDRKVTPNGHYVAENYALFDNLYADGETSQGGHQWTDAGYESEYTESQWILSYSGRKEIESDKRLTSSPGEYIWSQARKSGLWARVYGEYVDVQEGHDSLESEEIKKDPERFGYCAEWEKVFARGGRDTEKVEVFLNELKGFEAKGKMPSLMVMALPDDHTHGYSAGSYSPFAMVGVNDLAVGRLLEALSRTKFWSSTAIFIIQDDAQNGPDHVDSHRTVGYVVSPYTRHKLVDSTHYSTASMLRTMGMILGTPPLSSYDANAVPMLAPFAGKPDFASLKALQPEVNLDERNPARTALSIRSSKLDFSSVDRADFGELNRILWEGLKPGSPYPAHLGM